MIGSRHRVDHGNGRVRAEMPCDVERQLQLANAIRERDIQLFDRGRSDASIVVEAMTPLETLHSFRQCCIIDLTIVRLGTGRQISDKSEKAH